MIRRMTGSVVLMCMLLGAVAVRAQYGGGLIQQDAVLEGVQISSEPSPEPGEKTVTCYFIFRDKPSSFFYEVKEKERKLVFEFNDVRLGDAPIESMSEPPLKFFKVEQRRVNVNEEIRGLEPEWHNVVNVTFELDNVPKISVTEEYSVISFSYKWTTDPTRLKHYVAGGSNAKWWIIGGSGAAVAAAVAVAVVLSQGEAPDEGPQPLDIGDLPQRTHGDGLP